MEDRAGAPVRRRVPGRRVDGGRCRRARSAPYAAWDAAVEAEHGPDAVWVAVSHGDVIKAILADALGIHLDAFQRIVRRPGLALGRALHARAAVRPHDQHPRRRPVAPRAAAARGAGARAAGRQRRRGRRRRRPGRPGDRVDAMAVVHSFDPPERFVAGTVGPPGQRTFFLQARAGARVTSVALEKQQVSVLAERIDELLDELLRADGRRRGRARGHPGRLEDNEPARAADRGGVPRRHHDARRGTRTPSGSSSRSSRSTRPTSTGEAPRRRSSEPEPRGDARRARCRRRSPGRSASAPRRSWRPAGRPASSAAARSTRRVTSARAPTASGGADRDRADRRAPRTASSPRRRAVLHRGRARAPRAGSCRPPTRPSSPRRSCGGVRLPCVYKPVAGERPLWDFPDGTLAGREVAAYLVSEALGWDVVPLDAAARRPARARAWCRCWREPDPERGRRSTSCPRGRCRTGYLHVLDATDGARPPRLAGPRGQRRAAPDGGLRRPRQQRRPQGRARARDARRPPLRRRPRRLLPRRRQAPHRAVGLGAASRCDARGRAAAVAGLAERLRRATSASDAVARRAAHRRRGGRARGAAAERLLARGRDAASRRAAWPSIPWPAF